MVVAATAAKVEVEVVVKAVVAVVAAKGGSGGAGGKRPRVVGE